MSLSSRKIFLIQNSLEHCILNRFVCKHRKWGRLRIRWLDNVLEDLKRMVVRSYCEMAADRRHWRRSVLEARGHVGGVVLKKNVLFTMTSSTVSQIQIWQNFT